MVHLRAPGRSRSRRRSPRRIDPAVAAELDVISDRLAPDEPASPPGRPHRHR